jgi:hypothetical protein
MLLRDQVAKHGFTPIKGTNDSFLYLIFKETAQMISF